MRALLLHRRAARSMGGLRSLVAARLGVARARRCRGARPARPDRRCCSAPASDAITGGLGGAAVDGFGAILEGAVRVAGEADQPRAAGVAGRGARLRDRPEHRPAGRRAATWPSWRDDVGDGVRGAGRGRHGGGAALLGGGAERVGRLRRARGPGADGRGGAVRSCVAVAVPARADLANAAGRGLLGSGSVLDDTSRLLAAAFAAAVSLNFLAIVIACAAGAAVSGVADVQDRGRARPRRWCSWRCRWPLMLWVIPELEWIARAAMRAFAVVLVIPVAWALCFATFAAVGDRRARAQGRRRRSRTR